MNPKKTLPVGMYFRGPGFLSSGRSLQHSRENILFFKTWNKFFFSGLHFGLPGLVFTDALKSGKMAPSWSPCVTWMYDVR